MDSTESKTKKSSRNLIFGVVLKAYQLFVPFIIRTIIIKVIGMEYAGLNSLFISILQVLNIAELGVGSVLVYSMYRPIEENNKAKICALMKLYKLYYRIIGCVILCIGLIITPFLPKLVKGEVPDDINIYILYFMNLGATVLSYWLFAYKNSLFLAHQRNDVISKVTLLTNTIMYVLQITLLITLKNYYTYVIIIIIAQIMNNIIVAVNADHYFPEYKASGTLNKEEIKTINGSIKDIFYAQLGLIVTTSVDSIVISAFLGLIPLAIYQNYYYVLNAVIGFFLIFFQSCRASVGTNLVSKSMKENFNDYKFITFIVIGALAFCTSCLLCMYQPFIQLWVGENNMLDYWCVILFGLYLIVYEYGIMIGVYKDSSGKWHADRFRPLLTALVNLITNIILVNTIGIYGILISTIISFLLIYIPWLYHRVFIDVFDYNQKKEYSPFLIRKTIQLIAIVALNAVICNRIQIDNLFITLLLRLILCTTITVLLYYFANKNTNELRRGVSIFKGAYKKVKRKV